MDIHIKLLSENGKIPVQATECSAGYDLFSAENVIVAKQERKLIKTNISMSIPIGFYGRIAPRSGLAYKHGIDIMAGVIDADYRGDIGVILYNSDKNNDFEIKIGDKIAQIIIEKCHGIYWVKSESLRDTSRGEKGYGHSG